MSPWSADSGACGIWSARGAAFSGPAAAWRPASPLRCAGSWACGSRGHSTRCSLPMSCSSGPSGWTPHSATRPGAPAIDVFRDAPPAFSVGRVGDVSYRWVNATARLARLRVREVRPGLLGGTQPPRPVSVPPHGEVRDAVSVHPVRRGREQAESGFATDSIGPLGLGRRRAAISLPWDAAVYP